MHNIQGPVRPSRGTWCWDWSSRCIIGILHISPNQAAYMPHQSCLSESTWPGDARIYMCTKWHLDCLCFNSCLALRGVIHTNVLMKSSWTFYKSIIPLGSYTEMYLWLAKSTIYLVLWFWNFQPVEENIHYALNVFQNSFLLKGNSSFSCNVPK